MHKPTCIFPSPERYTKPQLGCSNAAALTTFPCGGLKSLNKRWGSSIKTPPPPPSPGPIGICLYRVYSRRLVELISAPCKMRGGVCVVRVCMSAYACVRVCVCAYCVLHSNTKFGSCLFIYIYIYSIYICLCRAHKVPTPHRYTTHLKLVTMVRHFITEVTDYFTARSQT